MPQLNESLANAGTSPDARDATSLDFTLFLSERLHLSTPATLSLLGSFLLTFEPSGAHAGHFAAELGRRAH